MRFPIRLFSILVIFYSCLLLSGQFSKCNASGTIVLTDSIREYRIGKYLEVFEDKTGKLTIEDITSPAYNSQFVSSRQEIPYYSGASSNFWAKFEVINTSQNNSWILELENEYMGRFDLYYPDDNKYKEVKGGFMLPYHARKYEYEFFLHQLPVKLNNKEVFYIRANSPTPVIFKLNIVNNEAFIKKSTRLEYLLGLYYGIVLVLFIYSLFNYIALNNKSYLWYAFYILFVALLLFCIDGRMYRYVTSDFPVFNLKLLDLIMIFGIFFGVLYSQSFLDTKRLIPKFNKIFIALKFILLFFALLIPFVPLYWGVKLAEYLPIPFMALIIAAGFLCLKKKHRPALLFLFGFGLFAIGAAITNLAFSGVIFSNAFTTYAMHAGSALEAIFLMFGLSQQMRLMKIEKESAQQETIKQLMENEQLQTKVNRELEEKVSERTAEVVKQKEIVEEQNKEIKDSILYAKRIQEAILPKTDFLNKVFPNIAVLYQPKDIVSGDFYWASEKDGKKMIAAVDCTGHGVPGAFMSMVGNAILNEIINEKGITKPDKVLNLLRDGIINALHQTGAEGESKDGMDISFCTIDTATKKLQFAGANNPLYLIRDDVLTETKGDKQPIGVYGKKVSPFTIHEFTIQEKDIFYIFTDGFADQFGGPKGKKFMYKSFKELLVRISRKPMEEQKRLLEKALSDWRGKLNQIDDVLVIGVGFPEI